MKKLLVHSYCAVNLGDDLFLKILRERYPDTEITLDYHIYSDLYSRFIKFNNLLFFERIVRKLFFKINRRLANYYTRCVTNHKIRNNYDATLLLGGSLFIQQSESIPEGDLYMKNLIVHGKKSFVIGANFGPFWSNEFLCFYKEVFRQSSSVVFRDIYSRNLFPDLNNISVAPDVVFNLPYRDVPKVKDTVGISVIDLSIRDGIKKCEDSYISFLINLTKSLLDMGKTVYLLSFCRHEGDENAINKILAEVSSSRLHKVFYAGDINSFLELYSSLEAVMVSRFHAMILSLVFKQKMFPLVYSDKMIQILNDINFKGEYIDLKNVQDADVESVIQSLYKYDYILPDEVKIGSELMFKSLDEFVYS